MERVARGTLGVATAEEEHVEFDDIGAIDLEFGREDSASIADFSSQAEVAEHGESLEIAALCDETSRQATRVLQERMLMNNPMHVYTKMLQCAESEDHAEGTGTKTERADGGVWAVGKRRLTILEWFPRLSPSIVRADLVAGVTVCVMAIPQSMSYANIAGLQYIYGMYSACIPTLVYSIFGQSRQLAVGPVAMVSLLVEAGLRGVLDEDQCPGWAEAKAQGLQQYEVCELEYARLTMLTASVVGLMQIIASVLKLGFLVSFLGHPVTSGFTSGAAIIIGLSQLKYILGFNVEKSQYVHITVGNILQSLHKTNPMSVFLGLLCLMFLIANKYITKKHKKLAMLGPMGPLICCFVGTLLMALCEPLHEDFHVKYVGDIPQGVMPLSLIHLDFSLLPRVLPTALTSCLIGYMESIAIGKNLAAQHEYQIEAGQELFALGVSNLIGASMSCYPVTGSFSRSAVNSSTGARSQLSGLITALMMFLTLLFLTPIFYYLPKFVLAAIVMNSVIPLVAYNEAKRLFKVKRHDFVLWVVAFLGTLFLGVLMGICVAVALSLLIVISESVRPQIAILWRIPGTTIYRSMKQESAGTFIPNVFICRIGSSMYFANAAFIKDTLLGYVAELQEVNPTEYIVLEMTPVVTIDSTALHCIHDLVSECRRRHIRVAFAMVGNRVVKTMRKGELIGEKKTIGEQWFFPNVNDAVLYCLKHQLARRRKAAGALGCPNGLNTIEAEGSKTVVAGKLEESMTDEEETLAAISASARPGNEVGVSNELHHAWTAIFVCLTCESSVRVNQIMRIFDRSKISVVQAQVDPLEKGSTRHTYMVQSAKHVSKLKDWEIERVREELQALVGQADGDHDQSRRKSGSKSKVGSGAKRHMRSAGVSDNAHAADVEMLTPLAQQLPPLDKDGRSQSLEEMLESERLTREKFQIQLDEQTRKLRAIISARQAKAASSNDSRSGSGSGSGTAVGEASSDSGGSGIGSGSAAAPSPPRPHEQLDTSSGSSGCAM